MEADQNRTKFVRFEARRDEQTDLEAQLTQQPLFNRALPAADPLAPT
jgi:hypothetical protein